MQNKLFIDEKLYLKLVEKSDAADAFCVIDKNREYLKKWLGWVDFIREVKDQEAFFECCIYKSSEKSEFCFGIHSENNFIGTIALKDINYLNKRAEIGYWLSEEYRGQGIMTKACKAVMDFAFNDLELNRLTILTATENFASQNVAKKLGFDLEGILRDNECLYGKFIDNYCFSCIKRLNIELIRASVNDANLIWNMQIESFKELFDKYQDRETNPGNEPIEKIINRLKQNYTYYYLIKQETDYVGAIRVVDKNDSMLNKRISPLFILPQYRNRKIAQKAILMVERMHGENNWELDTILEEKENCYLYEKMGYKQTGEIKKVNDKLTLVFYEKKSV